MPWKIVGNKVVRADTGKVVGRSKNPKKYLRALYANVHHKAYNPKQPRYPKGSSKGGQFKPTAAGKKADALYKKLHEDALNPKFRHGALRSIDSAIRKLEQQRSEYLAKDIPQRLKLGPIKVYRTAGLTGLGSDFEGGFHTSVNRKLAMGYALRHKMKLRSYTIPKGKKLWVESKFMRTPPLKVLLKRGYFGILRPMLGEVILSSSLMPTVRLLKEVQTRTQRLGRFMPILKKKRKYRLKKPIVLKGFNPAQPRYPKGNPRGGQWKGAVSGAFFTGGRQKAARNVARLAEARHGSLPAYRVHVTRGRLGGIETADYTGGQIRISHKSKTPHLDTAHEIGHLLDHRRYAFGSMNSPKFEGWRKAVDRSPSVKRWKAWNALGHIAFKGNRIFVNRNVFRYALDRREQFARSYAQYLTRKSRHRGLRRNLHLARKPITTYYWTDREFRPIEHELDRLFGG